MGLAIRQVLINHIVIFLYAVRNTLGIILYRQPGRSESELTIIVAKDRDICVLISVS